MFRGLVYGGGGGDDAVSSPADAASGSGAVRRVGGATGTEAPTGDVDRPGGGAKPVPPAHAQRVYGSIGA